MPRDVQEIMREGVHDRLCGELSAVLADGLAGWTILCDNKGWGHEDGGRDGLIRVAMLMTMRRVQPIIEIHSSLRDG